MQQLQFDQHYVENYNALMSFAYKLTNSKSEAEDLVQETAIKAYKNFNSFIKHSNFKNWSFTILKNTFLTKYRKNKKMSIVSKPVEEMLFAVSPNIVDDTQVKTNSNLQYLHSCISKLNPKSKKVFTLYINGYSYEEIGQVSDIPIGTVKSRISYARKKLQQIIDLNKINSAVNA